MLGEHIYIARHRQCCGGDDDPGFIRVDAEEKQRAKGHEERVQHQFAKR